jgi:hypothetical protein
VAEAVNRVDDVIEFEHMGILPHAAAATKLCGNHTKTMAELQPLAMPFSRAATRRPFLGRRRLGGFRRAIGVRAGRR